MNVRDLLNMKTMLCVGMVIVSMSALIAGQPVTPAPARTLRETDNGAVVVLTSKGRLMVRLPTQPGTGYAWTPKAASSLLRLVKSYHETPARMLPGGVETQVFVFTPMTSGTDEIELDYRRAWEHGGAPAKVFRFTATVE